MAIRGMGIIVQKPVSPMNNARSFVESQSNIRLTFPLTYVRFYPRISTIAKSVDAFTSPKRMNYVSSPAWSVCSLCNGGMRLREAVLISCRT